MNKVNLDHSQERLSQSLIVSEERAEELLHDINVSIWELNHLDRRGFTHIHIIEAHIKHAKNEQELTLQAFVAGRYIQANYEDFNYNAEEEEE